MDTGSEFTMHEYGDRLRRMAADARWIGLSPTARHVLMSMMMFLDGPDGRVAWITKAGLSDATGLSGTTVKRCLVDLRAAGLAGNPVRLPFNADGQSYVRYGFELEVPGA